MRNGKYNARKNQVSKSRLKGGKCEVLSGLGSLFLLTGIFYVIAYIDNLDNCSCSSVVVVSTYFWPYNVHCIL